MSKYNYNVKKKDLFGCFKIGEIRDKDYETGLKEGGGIEMSIYSAFPYIRDCTFFFAFCILLTCWSSGWSGTKSSTKMCPSSVSPPTIFANLGGSIAVAVSFLECLFDFCLFDLCLFDLICFLDCIIKFDVKRKKVL